MLVLVLVLVMIFIAQQQLVVGISWQEHKSRSRNKKRQPAVTSENRNLRLRLDNPLYFQLAREYHNYRVAAARKVSIEKSQKQMEVFLDYLAGGGFYRQVSFSYGVATSTGFMYCRMLANYFQHIAPYYISLPENEELSNLAIPLQMVDGTLKRVVLYIDGFIVRVQRPDHAGDAYYCGRSGKSCDSINVQFVVDKKESR